MEAFSMLKFWRITAAELAGDGGPDNDSTISSSNDGNALPVIDETDEEEEDDSFFELEFTVPGYSDGKHSHAKHSAAETSESDEDFPKQGTNLSRHFVESTHNSKALSPTSLLRSPPKFPVFMLFKKSRSEPTYSDGMKSPQPLRREQSSKQFDAKCRVEELRISSLLAGIDSPRRKFQKQSSILKRLGKDMVQRYAKLIKPVYVKVSKRYGEMVKFSDEASTERAPPALCSPRKSAEEKQGSGGPAALRVVCRHLGKSRSASSAVGLTPLTARRRDDSLLEEHDGILGAILHCKRTYNSSRDCSLLSGSESDRSYGKNQILEEERVSI